MNFLKTLSNERGFKFLLVCHDPRIIKHADFMYEMKQGKLTEIDVNGGGYYE